MKAIVGIIDATSLNLGDGLLEDPFHFLPMEPDETCVSCTLSSGKLLPPLERGLPAGLQVYMGVSTFRRRCAQYGLLDRPDGRFFLVHKGHNHL